MKFKTLIAGALLASSWTGAAQAAESDPQYLSDWWHQSVNVVGSYHTRFGPQFNHDVYLDTRNTSGKTTARRTKTAGMVIASR